MNVQFNTMLAVCLLLSLLSGCTGTPVRFDTVADRSLVDVTRGRRISAEAGGFQLFAFIPINVNSRHDRAYRELLEKAGNDAIADVRVSESWAYGLVGTTYWTIMEATAYPRSK
jgi:hypothetical protein